jgi:hypothetical protein
MQRLEERGHATAGSWCGAKNRREKGEGVQLMLTNFSHPPNRVQTKKF